MKLNCKIRRLSKAGSDLYIQLDRKELDRHGCRECEPVQLNVNGNCQLHGLVRTKGSVCWLGPAPGFANRVITQLLRREGLAHGSEVQATVVRRANQATAPSSAGGRTEGQP
jgi:hypothetical protein